MIRKNSKKGAVEMSLNLIIMLIIGMVVLGLVIGFVNSLVNKGAEGFDRQIGDNEKLKLDKVKSCSENLCVEPDPSVDVKKNGRQNIFLKVRAFTGTTPIICTPGLLDSCTELSYTVSGEDGTTGVQGLTLSGPGFNIPLGEEDAQMYTLRADTDVEIGIYYLTLTLALGTETISKTLTVEVN